MKNEKKQASAVVNLLTKKSQKAILSKKRHADDDHVRARRRRRRRGKGNRISQAQGNMVGRTLKLAPADDRCNQHGGRLWRLSC